MSSKTTLRQKVVLDFVPGSDASRKVKKQVNAHYPRGVDVRRKRWSLLNQLTDVLLDWYASRSRYTGGAWTIAATLCNTTATLNNRMP